MKKVFISLMLILSFIDANAQINKIVYNGGYFIREGNGNNWKEFDAILNKYKRNGKYLNQYSEDNNFYYLQESSDTRFAIPKTMGNNCFYSKNESGVWSEWEFNQYAPYRKIVSKSGVEFFLIKSKNTEGVLNENGKPIINLASGIFGPGYSTVMFMNDDGVEFFYVEKIVNGNKYVGICDLWGKEIIPPKRNDGAIFYDRNTGFYMTTGNVPLNVFMDSNNRAYRVINGSREYLSK